LAFIKDDKNKKKTGRGPELQKGKESRKPGFCPQLHLLLLEKPVKMSRTALYLLPVLFLGFLSKAQVAHPNAFYKHGQFTVECDYFNVKKKGKWGCLDSKGTEIVPCKFDSPVTLECYREECGGEVHANGKICWLNIFKKTGTYELQ
jgi:hypothetical protein